MAVLLLDQVRLSLLRVSAVARALDMSFSAQPLSVLEQSALQRERLDCLLKLVCSCTFWQREPDLVVLAETRPQSVVQCELRGHIVLSPTAS